MPPSKNSSLPSIEEDLRDGVGALSLSQPPTSAEKTATERNRSRKTSARPTGQAPRMGTRPRSSQPQSEASNKGRPTDSGKPTKKPPSRQSCSSFAAQPAVIDISANSSRISWLLEHGVIRIALCRLSGLQQDPKAKESINKMFDFYHEMSAFPDVDPALIDGIQVTPQLEEWRGIFKKEYRSTLFNSSKGLSSKLEPHFLPLLGNRIDDVLRASAFISHLNEAARGRAVFEAEYRRAWDGLLLSFTIADNQAIVSPAVLLERTLNLPRNQSKDILTRDNDSDRPVSLLEHYRSIAELNSFLWQEVVEDLGGARTTREAIDAAAAAKEAFDVKEILETLTEDSILAAVDEHSSNEPLHAIADALLVTPLPLPRLANMTSPDELKSLIHRAALIRYSSPRGEHFQSLSELKESGRAESAKSKGLGRTSSDAYSKATLVQGVQGSKDSTTSSDADGKSPTNVPASFDLYDSYFNAEFRLRWPFLAAEYKKAGKDFETAFNQARIYCAACVTFMRALGILDFAVFGLVTLGSKGWLIMCWNTKLGTQDQGFLFDTNVRTFDISSPVQCFHFAAILLRLTKYGHDITNTFNLEHLEGRFFAIGEGPYSMGWTKEAQAEEYKENLREKKGND